MSAILEFPAVRTQTPSRSRGRPDLAFETIPLWKRLQAALAEAATARRKARELTEQATRKQRRWGVPQLHFFHKPAQEELERSRTEEPASYDFGPALDHMLEDGLMLLVESLDVRRTARATAGLYEAANTIAGELPAAKELAELLRMPEGEAIRVIHPGRMTGYRLLTFGVGSVNQFHTLFADRVPGQRPPADAVRAAGAFDPLAEPAFAETRFRFLRPAALQADGRLLEGFRASDHWYWGHESLAEFPLENGERLVLADDPAFEETQPVERRFPRLPAGVEVLDVMSRAEVESWLRQRCPLYFPARRHAARGVATPQAA
jgi:hypothetical protein